MNTELEFAVETVRHAGELIMKYFRRPISIRQKGENDPVTEADLAADAFLRRSLLGRFPNDGWLSEETPVDRELLSRPRLWVVDPIDGTKEFIRGTEEFTVSVALVSERRPILAVVYNPATRDMFSAEAGRGAFRNGIRVHVSRHARLQGCRMIAGRHEPRLCDSLVPLAETKTVGSIAFKMALVACGDADVALSLDGKGEWDVCGGDLLVREAGGLTTDRDGEELSFGNPSPRIMGIVAANPSLHAEALRWIRDYAADSPKD